MKRLTRQGAFAKPVRARTERWPLLVASAFLISLALTSFGLFDNHARAASENAGLVSAQLQELAAGEEARSLKNDFNLLREPPPALSARAEQSELTGPLWQEVDQKALRTGAARLAGPRTYRTLRLDQPKFVASLAKAPLEHTQKDSNAGLSLPLPLADGTFETFHVVESPIMEAPLAAQFPQIKTYSGTSIDDAETTTRFDWTPTGFHAIVLSPKGTVLIEPYAPGNTELYLVYFQRNVPVESFGCGVSEADQEAAIFENDELVHSAGLVRPAISSDTSLRTYRLAVAATAEYTQTFGGGTVTGGLTAVTTTINLVDAIYEREVAIRLVLVANESSIIFTDSASDGYTSDNVNALISENQTKLDAVIGSGNYDIGHVFDGRNTPGSLSFQGVASIGSVCRSGLKARGVSITRSIPPSSVFAFYSTSHEMGHQFSATHTFNASTGNCSSERSPSTAYEPGTGSTIMGYRFTCGAEDLMSGDTYFHLASLQQIINYTTIGSGSVCPTQSATNNNPPIVDAGPAHTIPRSTPFILGALGSDPNGDALTFGWEEFDLGAAAPPDTDDGSRPIFRSFAPTGNPLRTFPRLPDILNGVPTFGESLPVTTRTMTFRVTARDNRFDGGAVSAASTQVNVRADSGPFIVTQPGSGATWPTGSIQTVTWSVANTDQAPVSCSSVRILLSTNGGSSFPIVLAEDTPNDGSEIVTLPAVNPFQSRIKVAANNNIFFNISPSFNLSQPANSVQFSSATYSGSESSNPKQVSLTVTRAGDVSGGATANYATLDNLGPNSCTSSNGVASSRCDYESTSGTVRFAPGETSKTISILLVDDAYAEGNESFEVALSNILGASFGSPVRATVTLSDNETVNGANPIDQADFFVRQQYLDFLNREPDPSGLAFWIDQITSCGSDQACIEVRRINGSAAFFLSTEFKETGYFVYRLYKTAYGDAGGTSTLGGSSHNLSVPIVRFSEFLTDTQQIGQGVVVNQNGWEQVLENNKKLFLGEFAQRIRFSPLSGMVPATFVDTLNTNAGNPLSPSERDQLVKDLTYGVKSQAQVLRAVAEDSDLTSAEFNRAFVLMQYFGYLRRNPNDSPDSDYTGYEFWLSKLNQFNGNFVNAEMVKAFITSAEYRQRF